MKRNSGKYFTLLNTRPQSSQNLFLKKNILKVSYSYMQNLKAKVDGHNKKNTQKDIIFKNKNIPLLEKKICLMKGACLIENVLYYAKIDL